MKVRCFEATLPGLRLVRNILKHFSWLYFKTPRDDLHATPRRSSVLWAFRLEPHFPWLGLLTVSDVTYWRSVLDGLNHSHTLHNTLSTSQSGLKSVMRCRLWDAAIIAWIGNVSVSFPEALHARLQRQQSMSLSSSIYSSPYSSALFKPLHFAQTHHPNQRAHITEITWLRYVDSH